jgi:hypothetical protein
LEYYCVQASAIAAYEENAAKYGTPRLAGWEGRTEGLPYLVLLDAALEPNFFSRAHPESVSYWMALANGRIKAPEPSKKCFPLVPKVEVTEASFDLSLHTVSRVYFLFSEYFPFFISEVYQPFDSFRWFRYRRN